MGNRRVLASAAALSAIAVAVGAAPGAMALDCPTVVIEKRFDQAEAAFVGRVLSERRAPEGGGARLYLMQVEQPVKGSFGRQVEIRSGAPLVDVNDKPLLDDASVGVLVTFDGATPTTSSCGLTDPSALLQVADKPKGNGIRLAVGVVILAVVLLLSSLRLKRRQRQLAESQGGAG